MRAAAIDIKLLKIRTERLKSSSVPKPKTNLNLNQLLTLKLVPKTSTNNVKWLMMFHKFQTKNMI